MANPQGRTFGEELNTWVQTVGILIAAAWGVWTFVYKEIKVPESAPINISLNLQLKRVGMRRREKPYVAVQMEAVAKNPSSRTVYLLRSAWIGWGKKLTVVNAKDFNSFKEDADKALNSASPRDVERHSTYTSTAIVATGSLFTDTMLKPSETITRTLLLYVPRDEYDSLEVVAFMPTVAKENSVELEWSLDEKELTVSPTMYRLNPGGERKPMERDKDGSYSDDRIGLQWETSRSTISLWQ